MQAGGWLFRWAMRQEWVRPAVTHGHVGEHMLHAESPSGRVERAGRFLLGPVAGLAAWKADRAA
ncbi:MAG: hypothetical protein D6740_13510 [Alphaproteobacteria bacterium]|nr:MAG: hypothetical protein D6740_13510 [Alphaproteobacteria bacterium]